MDDNEMTTEQWLALRTEEAPKIDPETAEIDWQYGQIMDPYRVRPDLSDEEYCVGRVYFARNPGSEIWVCFYDLSEETCKALWKKIDAGTANWIRAEEIPF
jgi:hypothetical protein